MKIKTQIMIPALDVMLILIILFLLQIFAIRFEANKGLGEKAFVPVKTIEADNEKFNIQPHPTFSALILQNNAIQMLKIVGHQIKDIKNFATVNDLSSSIIKGDAYYIYEETESELLGKVIRLLADLNVEIRIVKTQGAS